MLTVELGKITVELGVKSLLLIFKFKLEKLNHCFLVPISEPMLTLQAA